MRKGKRKTVSSAKAPVKRIDCSDSEFLERFADNCPGDLPEIQARLRRIAARLTVIDRFHDHVLKSFARVFKP